MNKNKPKPLDLEGLTDEIIRVEYPTYELTSIPQMKNAIIRKKQTIEQIIKHRIKQACEFYLRYKDNPELLWMEKKEIREKLNNFIDKFDKDYKVIAEFLSWDSNEIRKLLLNKYNEWLFKLAFRGVLND